MATKFGEFKDKIDYSWACTRHISEIIASNRGFSGLGNLMVSFHDRPLLPWQQNLENS